MEGLGKYNRGFNLARQSWNKISVVYKEFGGFLFSRPVDCSTRLVQVLVVLKGWFLNV